MSNLRQAAAAVSLALVLTILIWGISIVPNGVRRVTSVTNIHGIVYEQINQEIMVTQSLAHFDVQLLEPVIAKQLKLSFSFRPEKSQTLAVGVRENNFWLSYQPVVFYEAPSTPLQTSRSTTITIPLTDKLQDADRSIDVMFITNNQTEASLSDEANDTTLWYLRDVRAEVAYDWPTRAATLDYLRSILKRERPL